MVSIHFPLSECERNCIRLHVESIDHTSGMWKVDHLDDEPWIDSLAFFVEPFPTGSYLLWDGDITSYVRFDGLSDLTSVLGPDKTRIVLRHEV